MFLSDKTINEHSIVRRRHCGTAISGDDFPRAKRVIIVGAADIAKEVADVLSKSARPRYEVLGFVTDSACETSQGMNILGSASDVYDIARSHNVDEIIIATVSDWQNRLAGAIASNGNGHPKVRAVPSAYESMALYSKLARVDDIPLVTLNRDKSALCKFIKRSFDIGFSILALCISFPVLLGAAVLTKLTSRGPVFFEQLRVGKGGREFMLFKLRTMVVDAERATGPILSSAIDNRVTPIGRICRRLKIDEIPQFINVLKGDMSVVGPRPERRCFVEQHSREIPGYDARHQVRPGITGLAQVYGGYSTDPATKLKYDLMYAFGGSLWTDLKIIALTLPTMLFGD